MPKPKPAKPQPATVSAYLSNPFKLLFSSFKTALSLNTHTYLGLVVALALTSLWGLLLVVGLTYASKAEMNLIWLGLLLAAFVIWQFILLASLVRYALATASRQHLSFSQALRGGYQKASGMAGLTIAVALLVFGGLLLFVVPGLLFLYWFLLAPYVYMDQDVKIVEALRRSKRLVSTRPAEVMGLGAAVIIFSLPGLVPVFGSVYSTIFTPIFYIAFGHRYLGIKQASKQKTSRAAPDPMNYVAVVLALLALVFVLALAINGAANLSS